MDAAVPIYGSALSDRHYAWLGDIYRHANKPDQNLGVSEPGPSVCRMTRSSALALMKTFAELSIWPPEALQGNTVFVDLGCGRGLVCAAAAAAGVKYTFGWDINAREISWAKRNIQTAFEQHRRFDQEEETEDGVLFKKQQARINFDEGDVREFCLERDIGPQPQHCTWILAFWFDWGPLTCTMLGRHLLFEDSEQWSVFACTERDLLKMCAHRIVPKRSLSAIYTDKEPSVMLVYDELDHARLLEAFERCGQLSIHLCGSQEGKTLYFYRRRK